MKHKLQTILSLLCIAALLLSGCTGPNDTPEITESLIWESAPALNFGTMAHEKLKVEPWYSGRCEATGDSRFAETELGYYLAVLGKLYYADKANLNLWVPVCNQADCFHGDSWHYGQPRCTAHIGNFVIRNGRIYFVQSFSTLWEDYSAFSSRDGICIASRALDGTDLRFEYTNDDMALRDHSQYQLTLTRKHLLYSLTYLNPDGSNTYKLFRITEEGSALLSEQIATDFSTQQINHGAYSTNGEETFYHYFLDENLNLRYRFEGGELVKYDFSDIRTSCAMYLSGSKIRLYRQNDGYYDIDLETREEVRIGDAQLKDAFSHILMPNCIIESTISFSSHKNVAEGEKHSLKLFDGERWHDVQLPPELQTAEQGKYLSIQGITSDSIFFTYMDSRYIQHLYRIPLGTDMPVLEYCADLP